MKHQTKNRVRYLLFFLLFVLFFTASICLFIFIGTRTVMSDEIAPKPTQKASPDLPVIVIDAGHGGEDGGAIGQNGVYEKDINLSIAKQLDQMLRSAGYETVMTRTEDILLYDRNSDYKGRKKILDLAARLNIAKEQKNAVVVSIHMNAFPQTQYSGLQVYYSPNHAESVTLAQSIQSLAKETLMPQNDRKVKPSGGNIFLLDRCEHPAVLVECGFLSNVQECDLLSTEAYQNKLATMLFCAITGTLSDTQENPQAS